MKIALVGSLHLCFWIMARYRIHLGIIPLRVRRRILHSAKGSTSLHHCVSRFSLNTEGIRQGYRPVIAVGGDGVIGTSEASYRVMTRGSTNPKEEF
jgi:hypothetical protein